MKYIFLIKQISYRSKGDKICNSCFDKREKNATNTNSELVLTQNWGLLCIPFVQSIAAGAKIIKRIMYPDGYIHHVYINGSHEQWSKHSNNSSDLQKCNECYQYRNIYYKLESIE